jgi:hypothetical protein
MIRFPDYITPEMRRDALLKAYSLAHSTREASDKISALLGSREDSGQKMWSVQRIPAKLWLELWADLMVINGEPLEPVVLKARSYELRPDEEMTE